MAEPERLPDFLEPDLDAEPDLEPLRDLDRDLWEPVGEPVGEPASICNFGVCERLSAAATADFGRLGLRLGEREWVCVLPGVFERDLFDAL